MRAELMLWRSVLAFALAAPAWGCAASVTCGEGTREQDGLCVLVAPPDAGTVTPVDAGTPDAGPTESCSPACGTGFTCIDDVCLRSGLPGGWRCAESAFADGERCDCDCGAIDPDCNGTRPVTGCLSARCEANGTCAACVPDCTGKTCGDDGCGGSCGGCVDPILRNCIEGRCAACTPDCEGKTCGDDGCGGTCGSCAVGRSCVGGECLRPPANASCVSQCGGITSSGCSCTADCVQQRDCCADVAICGCQPNCSNVECGDDGCGGSCGSCDSGGRCNLGLCVDDPCLPDPCGGRGTCAPATGACTCATNFAGARCDRCAPGYVSFPDCVIDACLGVTLDCGTHGACDPLTGACACNPGYVEQGGTCVAAP